MTTITPSTTTPAHVVVTGGGVGALEAVLAPAANRGVRRVRRLRRTRL